MSRNSRTDDETPTDEPFLQRFSRRKLEARALQASPATVEAQREHDANPSVGLDAPWHDKSDERGSEHGHDTDGEPAAVELTDDDMPPLDTLTPDSDYRGFMSAKVSEGLRRAALRKLFHSSSFNVICELDDYAEDYTVHAPLGSTVTAEMQHRIDREHQRREAAQEHARETELSSGHEPSRDASAVVANEQPATPDTLVANAQNADAQSNADAAASAADGTTIDSASLAADDAAMTEPKHPSKSDRTT